MSYSVTKLLHFCKMSENSMMHIHIFLENYNGNLCFILSHDDLLELCVLLTQIYGEDEWSFRFWEQGTGVFSYLFGKNPMYTLYFGLSYFVPFMPNNLS